MATTRMQRLGRGRKEENGRKGGEKRLSAYNRKTSIKNWKFIHCKQNIKMRGEKKEKPFFPTTSCLTSYAHPLLQKINLKQYKLWNDISISNCTSIFIKMPTNFLFVLENNLYKSNKFLRQPFV